MLSSNLEKIGTTYYYDLQIFNNSSNAQNLSFMEQRQTSILPSSADNYRMSIIRFACDSNLPTIIPQVQTINNTDINKLVYSWTMNYKTYTYQKYINFIPQNLAVAIPTSDSLLNKNVIEDPYYWINDSMSFINMLNQGLVDCWNGLNALVIAGGDTLPNTNANIYLEMNPTTNIINLVSDALQYDNALPNYISLYMNSQLHSYLKAFENLLFYGYKNLNGNDIKFNIRNFNGLNTFTNNSINYLMTYSEYSVISSWSPINSIVLTSSLPVKNTLISSPNVIDDQFLSNTQISLSEKQISDFQINGETNINSSGKITYTAQIYRYIALDSLPNLTNILVNFYWKSKLGNYYSIVLDSSGLASIKIMFEKV